MVGSIRSHFCAAGVAFALSLTAATWSHSARAESADAITTQIKTYTELYEQTGDYSVLWLLAEASAEAGDKQKALAALNQIASVEMGFFPTSDSSLYRLRDDPAFKAIFERMRNKLPSVRRARTAFTVERAGLVPEGIAFDPRSRQLFISDMHNKAIWAIAPDGRNRAFAKDMDLRPIGMRVDERAGLLWVATTTAFWAKEESRSALLAFDLKSGRLAFSATSPELASLNDLTIAPNGDIFITDSLGGSVFRLAKGSRSLERFTGAARMGYPNGIAITDDGRTLFIAQGASLRRINVATGEVKAVAHPSNLTTMGIDGMYWHEGALVGVQAGGTSGRVLRMELDESRSAVTRFSFLEAGNPSFDKPTTAALDGDRMFVIANSQLHRMGDDGTVSSPETLRPIVVLELPIRTGAK